MSSNLILLLGGLVLIIKGGDWFVTAAVRIAEFLRMPRVVIGSTLVSLATTTPELVVSIMAGLRGEPGLAVGNAVGSVICNIGLILGVTAAIKDVDVQLRALRLPLVLMCVLGGLLFGMTLDLRLSRAQGVMLLLAGVAYFVFDFVKSFRERKPEAARAAAAFEEELVGHRRFLATRAGAAVQFVGGAGVVVLGSRLLVDGAVNVAAQFGIPSIIVGLTVVAVGTSLPELVTAVTSARQNVSDLSVGNVLGANIANLSLIVGTASLLQEVSVDRTTQLFNFPAMLVMMALLVVFLRTGQRMTRREGVSLLAAYALYLLALVGITLAGR